MTTTVAVGEAERETLLALMGELVRDGRHKEATALAKVYTAVCVMLNPELAEDDEDDEELAAALEEAERDFAEGRWIPHEEMLRRLAELDRAEAEHG
jgi:hypothetical protein